MEDRDWRIETRLENRGWWGRGIRMAGFWCVQWPRPSRILDPRKHSEAQRRAGTGPSREVLSCVEAVYDPIMCLLCGIKVCIKVCVCLAVARPSIPVSMCLLLPPWMVASPPMCPSDVDAPRVPRTAQQLDLTPMVWASAVGPWASVGDLPLQPVHNLTT